YLFLFPAVSSSRHSGARAGSARAAAPGRPSPGRLPARGRRRNPRRCPGRRPARLPGAGGPPGETLSLIGRLPRATWRAAPRRGPDPTGGSHRGAGPVRVRLWPQPAPAAVPPRVSPATPGARWFPVVREPEHCISYSLPPSSRLRFRRAINAMGWFPNHGEPRAGSGQRDALVHVHTAESRPGVALPQVRHHGPEVAAERRRVAGAIPTLFLAPAFPRFKEHRLFDGATRLDPAARADEGAHRAGQVLQLREHSLAG